MFFLILYILQQTFILILEKRLILSPVSCVYLKTMKLLLLRKRYYQTPMSQCHLLNKPEETITEQLSSLRSLETRKPVHRSCSTFWSLYNHLFCLWIFWNLRTEFLSLAFFTSFIYPFLWHLLRRRKGGTASPGFLSKGPGPAAGSQVHLAWPALLHQETGLSTGRNHPPTWRGWSAPPPSHRVVQIKEPLRNTHSPQKHTSRM